MQITNSNKRNPEGKSSVFENIIEFSNEANILIFFPKGILNFKSKCPRPFETRFQELFEGELLCGGKNPSPTMWQLHRVTEGEESMGDEERKKVEDGGRKKQSLEELPYCFLGAPQNTVDIPSFPF